jgi:CHAT domain-containing protein
LQGTQLVVLSACNTGNGTVLPGEGLASLRRAVEMAGARSSITTLWSVPSEASAELMRHLYGHVGAGMAPGAALHRAKQAMIRQGRPPLDWAGFVFAGTDAALVAPQRAAQGS